MMPGTEAQVVRRIALMNQKGGVGKTTTTVNLAAAFAEAGRPTLIVDLDPQAHASLHLGVEPSDDEPTVYDALLDPANAAAALREVRPNLALLPSTTDLAAVETELANAPDRLHRLARSIDSLHRRFEFVLIDCPPSLGLLTLNGLVAAREVLIPMQAHFLALQGVGKLLETVKLVGAEINPRLRVLGVVLCMFDSGSTHTREVVADLDAFFEQTRSLEHPWKFARVFRPAIRRNIKLAECPSFGKTIFEYAPSAPGADDYRELAALLLREWDSALGRPPASASPPAPEPAAPAPEIVVPASRSAPGAPVEAGG